MRILFSIAPGILPEQRINRWQMVSTLYAALGKSFLRLGHPVYFYVHPQAVTADIPPHLCWTSPDHEHLPFLLERFQPDFVFTWNGSSMGDRTTATIVEASGAKMVYSEQGWFPQADTLYFDFSGCNGACSTRNKRHPALTPPQLEALAAKRAEFIGRFAPDGDYDASALRFRPFDTSKPIMVPLQDERDLNIILDSPFKTMDAFVGYLSRTYPDWRFLARPHPKYPSPVLAAYENVELANHKEPIFQQLSRCGGVMGINSTTLLESALLGMTVVSFGNGLASGTGTFIDRTPEVHFDPGEDQIDPDAAASLLHHLLLEKQMPRADLGLPVKVISSDIFKSLIKQIQWNTIAR